MGTQNIFNSDAPVRNGNRAMREKKYELAIKNYIDLLKKAPAWGALIASNIEISQKRYKNALANNKRQHIAVCGWDLSHNAAGRVYTIAKMYELFADVEIIGCLFPQRGNGVWEPIRNIKSPPVHTITISDSNNFLDQVINFVSEHPYEVVHLSKPRITNIFFGILYKLIWGSKVIIDVDDDELGFVGNVTATDPWSYIKENGELPSIDHLDGTEWTRLAVGMVEYFDGITVVNKALQDKFGGKILKHARDEKTIDTKNINKSKLKNKLGIDENAKIIIFFGTPRSHKGLLNVANAIKSLNRSDVLFLIIGKFDDESIKNELIRVSDVKYKFLENQSFDSINNYMAIGDFCVLMQDGTSSVSRLQTPAKLTDALAAGVVVLATDTPGLADATQSGAVVLVNVENLASKLDALIHDPIMVSCIKEAGYKLFVSEYSFSSNVEVLKSISDRKSIVNSEVVKKLLDCPLLINTNLSFLRDIKLKTALKKQIAEGFRSKEIVSTATAPAVRKLPITVLVVTWDVGHNPLGRSYMLAEAIDRVARNVVLVGFQFSRYGDDIWEPVRNGKLPVISLPGSNLPEFLESIEEITKRFKPDIVVSCKPRLPSMLLGLNLKAQWGCPWIIDDDDHELSFFKNQEALDLAELSGISLNNSPEYLEPYSEVWTRLSQSLCKYSDELLVSNIALQKDYGGVVIPHVRDETVFDPALHDRLASRAKYGVDPAAKVLLFFGTPRLHKGVDTLAQVVGKMPDDTYRLVVVGTSPDRSVTAKLNTMAPGRIVYLPNQPFSDIPAILAMADVVCLPQDVDHPISRYQLPAKAIDAVGMGIPLLVTRTPPLMQLVNDGVAIGVDKNNIANEVHDLLSNPEKLQLWRQQSRPRFLAKYSYQSAAEKLREVFQRVLVKTNAKPYDLKVISRDLFDFSRRAIGYVPAVLEEEKADGVDVVLFWKQNDTGIYGRRHDMIIKYLASRDDVRKVIVFDAPLSEFDLIKYKNASGNMTQDRVIYTKTYEKIFGKLNTAKIKYNVFVHAPGKYKGDTRDIIRAQLFVDYRTFISDTLEHESVDPDRSVFWLFPKNDHAADIIRNFKPRKVVVDVVDDHRAWPNISIEEKTRLTINYKETLALADMAFVNCEPVRKSMEEFHPDIRLVPNGCDLTPPAVKPKNSKIFEEVMSWPGATIGFVGNLEAKIDIALIEKVAQQFADCQIVLLGSTHANPAVRRLADLPNIKMPGVVPYEQLGAWLAKFDVGMIPHLDTEMTRSMNPLKLYVYLTAGVPVVATAVSNIAKDNETVFFADNHDQFIKNVHACIKRGRLHGKEGKNYINENSWDSRFKLHIDDIIKSTASSQL